jgi:hypothetical protein
LTAAAAECKKIGRFCNCDLSLSFIAASDDDDDDWRWRVSSKLRCSMVDARLKKWRERKKCSYIHIYIYK